MKRLVRVMGQEEVDDCSHHDGQEECCREERHCESLGGRRRLRLGKREEEIMSEKDMLLA